jgi:hypothetical protein
MCLYPLFCSSCQILFVWHLKCSVKASRKNTFVEEITVKFFMPTHVPERLEMIEDGETLEMT